jgi:excisionase family DNA binding protein
VWQNGSLLRVGAVILAAILLFHMLHLFHLAAIVYIIGDGENTFCVQNQGDVMSGVLREKDATLTPASEAGRPGSGTSHGDKIEITVNGVRIEVSPELEDAVHRAHKGLLRPLPKEMTTNQAADFLDVSRPFVIKLIGKGELPCRMVGKHRRIPSEAVLAYRERMFQQARNAADEMVQLSQDAGLYGKEIPKKAQ